MGLADLYTSRTSLYFGGVEADPEKADMLVAGVPYDATSSYRRGSRFAPRAIREAAANIEFYSLRAGIDIEDYRITDLGDMVLPVNPPEAVKRIETVIAEILENNPGKLLALLGGEHSITLGAYRALARHNANPCMLVADAHFDLRSEYMEEKYSHASVMRRITEVYGGERVFYIGVRAFAKEELEYARSKQIEYITSHAARLLGVREVVSRVSRWIKKAGCQSLYVSIDMDTYDPAYAPGVANPEPEGLEPWILLDTIFRVVVESGISLRIVDIVEVSPPYDCSEITSVLAAKTLLEVFAAYLTQRAKSGR
ncbi:MAG TPA: agmatinase [Pyrodictium delaneyi]|uniref:Agmatinase n=1 Tax=Pyrodictium delaneyi TaxID=1273541 RepID=A0A833EBG7_9CREN|nr:agmatinase [Pyrodictium delaneyi]